MDRSTITVIAACLVCSAFCSVNAESPKFETHVRAILKKHCWQCHGEEETPEGGLDLRLVRFMRIGGESGPAIVPGAPEKSVLLQRLRDEEMPPDLSKLISSEELEVLESWVAAGAETLRVEPETIESDFITEEELNHWSFQPIQRPRIPTHNSAAEIDNPIDAFLLARLNSQYPNHQFGFSQRAKSETLVRRLYLDLHGLPPAPDVAAEYTRDDNPERWRLLVDQLLDSKHYGERWARHWLDVAGYADSEGYNDADTERKYAWRYRDYVIRAFNSDKPFDQFIREQLAGDELISSPFTNLSDHDAELLTATGFLRMAPDGTGGAVADAGVARNETIADTIKIVSSSLLGMTVGCAQCHDHRYDPISQVDYYRFRAIFEPAFDWTNWRPPAKRRVTLYTDADRAEAARVEAEAAKTDTQRTAKQQEFIKATFEKQLASLPAEIHEAARAAHATTAAKRTSEQKALFRKYPKLNVTSGSLYLYDKAAADKLAELAAEAKKIRARKPREEFVRALTEVSGRVPPTHLFYRGDHEQPKQEVQPAGLTVLSRTADLPSVTSMSENSSSSQRRLTFANRLTDPAHPLTARVIANRIWMHHFGRGLVTTPTDFGILGLKPSHPALLDWLASELIDSGWSVKHLHRLILTSNAWQQAIRPHDALTKLDPDNTLYGGARMRRLDAEIIRDSMLAVAGKLNTNRFGPPVPVMADRVGRFVIGKENLNAGRPGSVIDMKGEQFRRSIYIQVRRSRPLSALNAFDLPAMSPNCDLRRPSTNSTQSLMMINSDLLLEYSRYFADRLSKEAGTETIPQIKRAWNLAFCRAPEHSELETAERFLADQTAIFATQAAYTPTGKKSPERTAAQEALAVMCQMIFSTNEFLYID